MAARWALVVATDRFLDPAFGSVPYAEAGARGVAAALAAAGYPASNQFLVLGTQATKTIVESRLRKLRKAVRRGDEVLAYWAGLGYARAGSGFLACWDTQPDDLLETGLPVVEFLAGLTAGKTAHATVLLDVGAGSFPREEFHPYLDATELAQFFDESGKAAGLAACGPGEVSNVASNLRSTVWTSLVTDALGGRLSSALDRSGRLTARSLHESILEELPRVLRRHVEPGVEQTPRLYGESNAGSVIADLSAVAGAGGDGFLLDPERLQRVVFRSESAGRVRDLTNWRKTYDVPTRATVAAGRFVARTARPDVKADLDEVYEAVRERLGYRRKDLDVHIGSDDVGRLRTPAFEYSVGVALDPADPSRLVWRREVGQLTDPGIVRSSRFDAIFGKSLDQIVFEFARPVDVAALVDRLEDHPQKGVKVRVASDGTSCEVTLAGFSGRVTVGRTALTIRGRAGHSAGLLDQFLAFLQTVGPLGDPLMLPPAR